MQSNAISSRVNGGDPARRREHHSAQEQPAKGSDLVPPPQPDGARVGGPPLRLPPPDPARGASLADTKRPTQGADPIEPPLPRNLYVQEADPPWKRRAKIATAAWSILGNDPAPAELQTMLRLAPAATHPAILRSARLRAEVASLCHGSYKHLKHDQQLRHFEAIARKCEAARDEDPPGYGIETAEELRKLVQASNKAASVRGLLDTIVDYAQSSLVTAVGISLISDKVNEHDESMDTMTVLCLSTLVVAADCLRKGVGLDWTSTLPPETKRSPRSYMSSGIGLVAGQFAKTRLILGASAMRLLKGIPGMGLHLTAMVAGGVTATMVERSNASPSQPLWGVSTLLNADGPAVEQDHERIQALQSQSTLSICRLFVSSLTRRRTDNDRLATFGDALRDSVFPALAIVCTVQGQRSQNIMAPDLAGLGILLQPPAAIALATLLPRKPERDTQVYQPVRNSLDVISEEWAPFADWKPGHFAGYETQPPNPDKPLDGKRPAQRKMPVVPDREDDSKAAGPGQDAAPEGIEPPGSSTSTVLPTGPQDHHRGRAATAEKRKTRPSVADPSAFGHLTAFVPVAPKATSAASADPYVPLRLKTLPHMDTALRSYGFQANNKGGGHTEYFHRLRTRPVVLAHSAFTGKKEGRSAMEAAKSVNNALRELWEVHGVRPTGHHSKRAG